MKAVSIRFALLFPAVLFGALHSAAGQGSYTLLQSLFSPSTAPQWSAQQGRSVAVDGGLTVVGSPTADVGERSSGVVKVYDTLTGALLNQITNPIPVRWDYFGGSVAVSGTRVAVAAAYPGNLNTGSRTVYVYDLTGGLPALVNTLTNPNPAQGGFGNAIALSGSLLVVGAAGDDTGARAAGAVFLYDLAGATPGVPSITLTNPTPGPEDYFGGAVAISGQRVVVGAIGDNNFFNNDGRAYVYDLSAPAAPMAVLNHPNPVRGGGFGSAVAISGSRVVVANSWWFDLFDSPVPSRAWVYDMESATPASPLFSLTNPVPATGYSLAMDGPRVVIGSFQTDSAYVYDLTALVPTVPVLTLTNAARAQSESFGATVGFSGNCVVVGAPGDDFGGSAFVYDLTAVTPSTPLAKLNDPSPASSGFFGAALSLSGTLLAVGAPEESIAEFRDGTAYVFDLASATPAMPWLILTNPAPGQSEFFGTAIALSGTRMVVSAPQDDTSGPDAGSAYVYNLAGPTPGVPVATLTNPAPTLGAQFGRSVAISGTRVVAGVEDTGRAYAYDIANANPGVPVATFTNSFVSAVAISGTRIVIGTSMDSAGACGAGSVSVYDLANATPGVPVILLTNPAPAAGDYFGNAVAISGSLVAVAAFEDDAGGTDKGSVYVFDLAGASPTVPVATLTNPSPATSSHFGSTVAISGNRVVVGTPADSAEATGNGIAYVYDLDGPNPRLPVAALRNPSPAAFDEFASAVSIDGARVAIGTPYDDGLTADRGGVYVFGVGPTLRFTPTAPGLAALSWTAAGFPGFVLQYSDSLAPTHWVDAPSGAMNPVTISTTNAGRFYRVTKP